MPQTQIAVIATMRSTVSPRTSQVFSAAVSRPKVNIVKSTPTSASEPITSTPVMAIAQPPTHPAHGPIARVTHENVVPQSWSTELR